MHDYCIVVAVAVLIVIILYRYAYNNEGFRTLANIDVTGYDIPKHSAVPHIATTDDCVKQCKNTAGCTMWNYNKDKKICYIKSIPADNNTVIGLKPSVLNNVSVLPKVYGTSHDNIKDVSTCANMCNDDPTCNVWEFDKATNECKTGLKNTIDVMMGNKTDANMLVGHNMVSPINHTTSVATSPFNCADKCQSTDMCDYWSYDNKTSKCTLNKGKPSTGFITGFNV